MSIADLMRAAMRNSSVRVRVPSKLHSSLGERARGRVLRLVGDGNITWVEVEVSGAGVHRFRPQDVAPWGRR